MHFLVVDHHKINVLAIILLCDTVYACYIQIASKIPQVHCPKYMWYFKESNINDTLKLMIFHYYILNTSKLIFSYHAVIFTNCAVTSTCDCNYISEHLVNNCLLTLLDFSNFVAAKVSVSLKLFSLIKVRTWHYNSNTTN